MLNKIINGQPTQQKQVLALDANQKALIGFITEEDNKIVCQSDFEQLDNVVEWIYLDELITKLK